MSSIATQIPAAASREPVFRLSVDQYHTMIDAGILTDDDPVELVEGILVQKMPKKPRHRFVIRKLYKALDAMLPRDYFVQSQEPITLSTSEPEPDLSVIRGQDNDFADRHPAAAEVPLVIEVSDATLRIDRGLKLRAYARAGIRSYWIVDLASNVVEVYTDPISRGREPRYNSKTLERSSLAVPLDGKKIGSIKLTALLA